ncbi:flagellar basal body rod protein [Oceanicaulis sp. HTCC2633]|jgi:flagellar hook-basal body complex protein FliE|uniref:flagellar hook-basal body complex protein FliE n=1 Tax=Oceanicaulis sp. HTCC2633 TaxID=314254 RepID=UPI000066D5D2|nr:flagellar hook-basal body complex protein FliE [Oceanicaulis sp. HTCC2633]EAP91470.1 flagellar basal body rod protein [Oceanicaulis sp. HTCC2633]
MDLAAIRAYTAAAQQAAGVQPASQTNPVNEAQGGDFGDMVMNAVESVQQTLQQSETLTAQAATGQAELVDVVTAVAAAEVQLESVVAVRDQVIRAYQEILRMPI